MIFQRTLENPDFAAMNELVGKVNAQPWRGKRARRWRIKGHEGERVGKRWRVRCIVESCRADLVQHVIEGAIQYPLYDGVDFRRIRFGRLLKRAKPA